MSYVNHNCPYAGHCPNYYRGDCEGCGNATKNKTDLSPTASRILSKLKPEKSAHQLIWENCSIHGRDALLHVGSIDIPVYVSNLTIDSGSPYDLRRIDLDIEVSGAPRMARDPIMFQLLPDIERVIFNDPATIVFWKDGSKTVVKAQNGEPFDTEKGLTMAIVKKIFGNEGNYYNKIKKWIK